MFVCSLAPQPEQFIYDESRSPCPLSSSSPIPKHLALSTLIVQVIISFSSQFTSSLPLDCELLEGLCSIIVKPSTLRHSWQLKSAR